MASDSKPPFILRFYDPSTQATDAEGRTLDEILNFSNDELEHHHDYIQYLFPLPERSPINPRAPVITREVRDAFLSDSTLRNQLRRSLDCMLKFYGFDPVIDKPDDENTETKLSSIRPARNFDRQARNTWLTRLDHNHLRISRIIRSLRVLALEAEARHFFQALVENDEKGRVSERSFMFWERAAERKLYLAPQDEDGAEGVAWLKDDVENGIEEGET